MRAMLLEKPNTPLTLANVQPPTPGPHQVLIRVHACGVCRTDLHVVDGELTNPKVPVIPGHEVVGEVIALGTGVEELKIGDRVGVPWLGYTCGACHYCESGKENLCEEAQFTGYTLNGGYAEFLTADERYCFPLDHTLSDIEVAPLLCAGLIGYRALRKAGNAKRLGLYGFGAAAHIVLQIAKYEERRVFAFTRQHDYEAQQMALALGAVWANDSDTLPPEELDAAIIFAPVGRLIPKALQAVTKGGIVICAGIHMSDIPSFPYDLLWGERTITSVANLTREDGNEFFSLAAKVGIHTRVKTYSLNQANDALADLRAGKIVGAAVLQISPT